MVEGLATRDFALWTIVVSLAVTCACYLWLSRREGSYLNILTPSFLINVPAYYLLPLVFVGFTGTLFGAEYSSYAYAYVYATLALESVGFVAAYLWTGKRVVRLPFATGYRKFSKIALICLGLGMAAYLPVLLEFRQFIFDPRQIYRLTRTGYGLESYVSAFLALLAVVFILFARCRRRTKILVVAAASGLLMLHGSKGQVLMVAFLIMLFEVYVRGRKLSPLRALVAGAAVAVVLLGLFAATMNLGSDSSSTIEKISSYSDYTRNAMLVIDSRMPAQHGRLTFQANFYSAIPRAFMPNKPKDFGTFYLAKKFYPEWFYSDTGSPAFGIGLQYADFGAFAIVYLLFFALLEGWLARIFVNRLKVTKHPADFVVMAFLAGVSIMPFGGVGWLFPEIIVVAFAMRYVSRIGARPVTFRPKQEALGHA
ncbi:MAG TPA: hypothetical protein VFL79_06410 [Terriglobia bacterium]|nr:hypothetical protein [Terriglobia bacterium]